LRVNYCLLMTKGNYYGTEVAGNWWKRYREKGFFARANGELWMDESGIHFRKLLTSAPLSIHWDEITGAQLGRSHAGRWAAGRPVLKVSFGRNELDLSAGFQLSPDWPTMEQFARDIIAKSNLVE